MVGNNFVIDTHIWISIFHRNRNEKFIDSLQEKGIVIFSCDEQCKELLDVIHRPELKGLVTKQTEEYIYFIDAVSEILETQKRFALLMDYKDNYLVDLAWQSQSILVSDDKHFSPLKRLQSPKVKVCSKAQFYKLLGR